MKVLVADDDRIWVELLGTVLRSKGLEVFVAFDGLHATMVAMKQQPDLIVLDVQMPGGTGVEALKRIKMSTKTGMIPVVVVSGAADAATARTVAQMGANRFIKKPTTADAVRDVVCELLHLE